MVTFYKNVTTITTKTKAIVASQAALEELDLSEMEYIEVRKAVAYNCGLESGNFTTCFTD